MGSITRYSRIERFVKAFGGKLEDHFKYLKGATAIAVSNYAVNYHVSADITLNTSNGEESFPTHLRWTSEEEDYERVEICEDQDENEEIVTYEEFLLTLIVGNAITDLFVNHDDRDDEVYLHLVFADEYSVAIPLGFDPENGEICGIAEDIISTEDFEQFISSF